MSEAPNFMLNQADNALPRFYVKAVQNGYKTEREGRPIYDNVEYVEIVFPGDRSQIVDRQVKPADKDRWPRQYEAFTREMSQAPEGMPLEDWPAVSPAQVQELKHQHIFTVEQMANLPDANLGVLGLGAHDLRARAQRFLAAASDSAPVEKLTAEAKEKDAKIAALEEQLAEAKRSLRTRARKEEVE